MERRVCVVSFSEKQLDAMEKFKTSRQPEELELKRERRGDNMEIVMKSKTKSTKQIDVSGINFGDVCLEVPLSASESKCVFDLMSVRVKVLTICKAETLDSGDVKQDLVVADTSCVERVTIWGESVETLEEGNSYASW